MTRTSKALFPRALAQDRHTARNGRGKDMKKVSSRILPSLPPSSPSFPSLLPSLRSHPLSRSFNADILTLLFSSQDGYKAWGSLDGSDKHAHHLTETDRSLPPMIIEFVPLSLSPSTSSPPPLFSYTIFSKLTCRCALLSAATRTTMGTRTSTRMRRTRRRGRIEGRTRRSIRYG